MIAFRPVIRCLALVLSALALASCTAPRLVYPRLDWLVSWKLGQYVRLDPAQERRFERDFDALWHWHQTQELARYGADLRELAAAAASPFSAQDVAAWTQRLERHSQRLLEHAMPGACALAASLSPAQRGQVLQRMDERIEAARDEHIEDRSEDEQREHAARRLRRTLQRWVGDLAPAQRDLVEQWSQARPQRLREWIAEREHWRDRFARTMESSGDARFCTDLQQLVLHPGDEPDGDLVNEAAARHWHDFLATFSATLLPAQREHLRRRLLDLAADFESLHAS